MRRELILAVAMLCAGCSGAGGHPSCDATHPCAAGNYCASTAYGGVCWSDAVRPVVGLVAATCSSACVRDGILHVSAAAMDDQAMGSVWVTLDLDPDTAVPMTSVGVGTYVADLALGERPFPWFEHDVVATVSATDEAGNEAVAQSARAVTVTRLRWETELETGPVALTAPALLADGTVVVAGSKLYFVGQDGQQTAEAVTVLSAAVGGPPSVASDAIWIAGQDGKVYPVGFDGTVGTACSVGDPVVGPPAVSGARVVAASQAGMLAVAATGFCDLTDMMTPSSAPPAVSAVGKVLMPAGGALRRFTLPTSGVLHEDWTGAPAAPSIGSVSAPIAVDASDATWSVALDGSLNRTTADALTGIVAEVPISSTGPIILSDGSAVVGGSDGYLYRAASGATLPWSTSAALSGAPAVPLALDGATPALLVPTSTGRLYALSQATGEILWSQKLSSTGQALQPANVWAESGAVTGTAYLAGADGKLYAVAVDGVLDTTAPWPKAFHDPRNTSNAGAAQ